MVSFALQKISCFVVVQSLSRVWLFVTPWTAAHQASLSLTISWSLLKLTFIESMMLSNHLILCHPLLFLPSVFPSLRVFSKESALHIRWWKYWSFSFSISPSNEYSGLISFRTDWLYLLVVQGTLKSLLQHHSSKASILRCSAFFIVQLSHPYMTTGKTIALTRQTFVGKVMSLLFNTRSRFVITFLPRSKCLLISWLQFLSSVILEPKKIKSFTFHFSPIYLLCLIRSYLGFPGGTSGEEPTCQCRLYIRDSSSIPGLGRSPGGGQGSPLQYSCLENPHEQRSLAGYSLWGWKALDMAEQLSTA